MNKSRFIAASIISGIILVILAVSLQKDAETPLEKTASSDRSAGQRAEVPYEQAAEKITSAGSYRMKISTTKITILGKQNFTETSSKILTCQDLGTPEQQIILEELYDYGMHNFSVTEHYIDGTAYVSLDSSHFSSTISAEAYRRRLIPVALVTPSLYNSVLTHQIGDKLLIGFSQPIAAEPWAMLGDMQLNDASGLATLDSEGNLVESLYAISYTRGTATVTYSVRASIEPATEVASPKIQDVSQYTNIDYFDVPRLLEQSTGYLLQANAIHAEKQEVITCQANNLRREQRTDLIMADRDRNLDVTLGIDVDLIDYNQGGTSTKYHQTETYQDGKYTLSVENQASPEPQEGEVTAEKMQLYCQDILVGTIILPEYIKSVSVTELDSAYQLTFSASEDLSEIVCSNACQTLYQDPALLNSLASSYQTDKIESTLVIDKQTGLPVSSGIDYSGNHNIEGTSYTLTSTLTQSYNFEP